jgi:hypothetical protein
MIMVLRFQCTGSSKGKKAEAKKSMYKKVERVLETAAVIAIFLNRLAVTMSLFLLLGFGWKKKLGQIPSVIGDNRNWYYDTSLLRPLFPWSFVSCGVLEIEF